MKTKLLTIALFFIFCGVCWAEQSKDLWKITYYCSCKKCCGANAKGITASGKHIANGMVACNWLKFGTRIEVKGLGIFIVEDRGAKSLFGDKQHHIKHIDIWIPSHKEALKRGVEYRQVTLTMED